MLDAVIIVLRETLEASLLVSFLFVFSNYFSVNKNWMYFASVFGIALAILVATELPYVSDLFDGTGQELLFFCVLITLSLLIQSISWVVSFSEPNKSKKALLKTLFASVIILAISLEGAEIIIYFQSGFSNSEKFYPNLLGSILGFGIGLSVGAISYYLLTQLTEKAIAICQTLLVLVSAGMASQAMSYLMQADYIDNGYPIWNTTAFIDERSVVGHLLYALMGYEATPSLTQAHVYFGYILTPLIIHIYYKTVISRKK